MFSGSTTLRMSAALATALFFTAVPLAAVAGTATDDQPESLSYSFFDSDGWAGAYESLAGSNDPAVVKTFLEAAAESPDLDPSQFGLDATDPEGSRGVLADAAENGVAVQPFSLGTAEVAGRPVNSKMSWESTSTFTFFYCPNILVPETCERSSLTWRMVTDPYNTSSRTQIFFSESGYGHVTSATVTTTAYASGRAISTKTQRWNTPGNATQWNTPHSPTVGHRYVMLYSIKIGVAAGTGTGGTHEWKSSLTTTCTAGTATTAHKCLFPAE